MKVQNVTSQGDPDMFALMQINTHAWSQYYRAVYEHEQHPVRSNARHVARTLKMAHAAQAALEEMATTKGYELGFYGTHA